MNLSVHYLELQTKSLNETRKPVVKVKIPACCMGPLKQMNDRDKIKGYTIC